MRAWLLSTVKAMYRWRLFLVMFMAALLLGGWLIYWRSHRLSFDPASVDRIEIVDALGRPTGAIEDSQTIGHTLDLMQQSSPFGVNAGGYYSGIQLRFFARDRELGEVQVGDYSEWAQNGLVKGYSDELANLARGLVRRHLDEQQPAKQP